MSKHWEPADVDRLIPVLTNVVARGMKAHAEAGAISERLETERQRIGLAGGGMPAQQVWNRSNQMSEQHRLSVKPYYSLR